MVAINKYALRVFQQFFFFSSCPLRDKRSKHCYANCIHQYIALTGLNLEQFHKMLDGLSKVHSYFEDLLTDYKIEPVEPLTIYDNVTMACYM